MCIKSDPSSCDLVQRLTLQASLQVNVPASLCWGEWLTDSWAEVTAHRCMPPATPGRLRFTSKVILWEAWSRLEVNPNIFDRAAFSVTKVINAHYILLKGPQNQTNSLVHESEPGTLLKSEVASQAPILPQPPCRSGHTMVMCPGEGAMSPRSIYFIRSRHCLGGNLI